MLNKVKTIDEAAALVGDGDTLALGGMTMYRRPVAFARALIRRSPPPGGLTLLAFTGGLAADILVGAGLVRYTRTCYFGLEAFGLAPMFTEAVHAGRITVIEESEASIANGLRAAVAGVGFMPSRAWQGTDMFTARPDVKTITDPYSDRQLTAFPAIHVDVVAIHVLRADPFGNAVLGGNPTIDIELAQIAQRIILTAEKVVDKLDGPFDIIGQPVTAVVEAPQGAWPTSCYPDYALDGQAVLAYLAACREGNFTDFVHEMHP